MLWTLLIEYVINLELPDTKQCNDVVNEWYISLAPSFTNFNIKLNAFVYTAILDLLGIFDTISAVKTTEPLLWNH